MCGFERVGFNELDFAEVNGVLKVPNAIKNILSVALNSSELEPGGCQTNYCQVQSEVFCSYLL